MILIDLLPYIGLFLLTILIPKLPNIKHYLFFLFLVFFLFSGFRYGVGWDYYNYLETIENGGWMIDRMEFFPRQLMLLCSKYGLTQTFYIVTSLLLLFCYFLMISKESESPAVSIFVFLCVPSFFLASLSTVRFSLAVSMIFLSYHYGYNKKYLLYFALLIAAVLTHNAALFGIITIPFILLKKEFSLTTNMIIFVVCFLIGTMIGSFSFVSSLFAFLEKSSPFLNDILGGGESYLVDKGNADLSKTPYVFALINLINLFYFQKHKPDESQERLGHYVTMFNLGCSIMFLFSFQAVFATRFSVLFTLFLLLIMPHYNNKSITKLFLYSIFVFIFFYQLTIKAGNSDFIGRINCWIPYRMYFGF